VDVPKRKLSHTQNEDCLLPSFIPIFFLSKEVAADCLGGGGRVRKISCFKRTFRS
jgi:hypothetical protein